MQLTFRGCAGAVIALAIAASTAACGKDHTPCTNCGTGAGGEGEGGDGAGGLILNNTGGSSADGGGGEGGACVETKVEFSPTVPTVVLLIDQSGSMGAPFGEDLNRWQAVGGALLDPDHGVVTQLDNDVRFGMTLYTSHNGFEGGTCPVLNEVAPALDNYEALATLFNANEPEQDTPTGESIVLVANMLDVLEVDGPKVIVLATDGEPDTCAVPNPQNGQQDVINATSAAHAADIETYVISVGDEVGEAHLQDVANAGVGYPVGGQDNAPYYQALDPESLVTHFQTIIDGVRSCTYTLDGEVTMESAPDGKVLLDNQELAYLDPDGWRLNSSTELELLGTACETIKTGQHTLEVSFPCDVFIPPPL